MKCRVFKKPDGSVVYNWPTEKYQDRLEDCKIPKDLKELPFIVLDEAEIPKSDSNTGDYHEMIYFEDGPLVKPNLKQDKAWEKRLMPVFLIKEKHLARLSRKIEEATGALVAIKLHNEKDLCKSWDSARWYQQALDNMDEDEIDKPVIRAKLTEKINSG